MQTLTDAERALGALLEHPRRRPALRRDPAGPAIDGRPAHSIRRRWGAGRTAALRHVADSLPRQACEPCGETPRASRRGHRVSWGAHGQARCKELAHVRFWGTGRGARTGSPVHVPSTSDGIGPVVTRRPVGNPPALTGWRAP